MTWSWKFARIAGTDIHVHITFLMVIAWICVFCWTQNQNADALIEGVGFVLALFACIVLSEHCHSLTARRYGIHTRTITLFPIGGVARFERSPDVPIPELSIALSAPAVNVILATVLFVGRLTGGFAEPSESASVSSGAFGERVMMANVFLAGFKLIPAFPIVGGRALRALLAIRMDYTRATQRAAQIAQGLAILFFIVALQGNPILMFTALFVWVGADRETGFWQNLERERHTTETWGVRNAVFPRTKQRIPHHADCGTQCAGWSPYAGRWRVRNGSDGPAAKCRNRLTSSQRGSLRRASSTALTISGAGRSRSS